MQLNVLRSTTEMVSLTGEWNHLLVNSAIHVPFLRSEYMINWWRTLGGGEWSHGDLYVVTSRQADGELDGVAPLFYSENREGERALLLLGCIEISDYLDVIAQPERLPSFLAALLDHLDESQAPDWQVLDLYNLLEDSPTLTGLKSAAAARGWRFNQQPLLPAPRVMLPGDWETYLAGIDKKQRHEIRRKLRRAEANYPAIRWYILEDESMLDVELDAFFDMMVQDPQKAAFLTETMRTQFQATAHAAFTAGWLQLAFLEVGGEKAAGYFNFDYDNSLWVYNTGIDLRFRDLSPGWVLLAYLLQWANEHKRTAFDFMRGNEDYKYRFGGVNRYVVRARISR